MYFWASRDSSNLISTTSRPHLIDLANIMKVTSDDRFCETKSHHTEPQSSGLVQEGRESSRPKTTVRPSYKKKAGMPS